MESVPENTSAYDLSRCGYWLVDITHKVDKIELDVIVFIGAHFDGEVYFLRVSSAKDLGFQDATGRDLYLQDNSNDVLRENITLKQPLFGISVGRYLQRDNWGPHVYAIAGNPEPIHVDDEDILFNDITRFRKAIQDNLTAHTPQKRPKRITIPFTQKSFVNMMGFGAQEVHFTNKRVGQLVYQPAPGQEAPTPEEYGLVMWVLKVTAPIAFRLVADAKRDAKPIIFKRGQMVNLQALKRRLVMNYPAASKTEVKLTGRYTQESLKRKLDGDQVKVLESIIGPFASKKPRNSAVETRFIDARRDGDPDHFKGCTLTLEYLPAKATLQVDFTFVIRNTVGDLN